jgi:hypothetical protein
MFDEDEVIPPCAPPDVVPCLKLWAAKLSVHLTDLTSARNVPALHRVQAEHWIFHSTDVGVGSFHWVCSILGVEEEVIRRGIHPKWWTKYKKEPDFEAIEIPQFKKKKYRTTARDIFLKKLEAMA